MVFDADYDWNLVSISVSDPFYAYLGHSIIGMEKQEILDLLEKKNIKVSSVEDVSDEENPNLELIESEEEGFMIWLQNDEVIEMQIQDFIEEYEEDEEETLN